MALNQALKHVYVTGSGVAINSAAKVRLVILTAAGAAAGTLVLNDAGGTSELNLACLAGTSVVVEFPGESGRQFGTNVTVGLVGAGVVADIYYES